MGVCYFSKDTQRRKTIAVVQINVGAPHVTLQALFFYSAALAISTTARVFTRVRRSRLLLQGFVEK